MNQSIIEFPKKLTILNDLRCQNVMPDPHKFSIRALKVCRHELHLGDSVRISINIDTADEVSARVSRLLILNSKLTDPRRRTDA